MHPLITIADRAARCAGKIIVRALACLDTLQYKEKKPHDFVSEIDYQAEAIIIDTIHKAYPNHNILAEESGAITHHSDYTWIIDPLDGTTNFIHGLPHFAISIGIQYKHRLEHGLIYDPIRQETFYASRGQGARLQQRRLRVSNHIQLAGALLGTGFPRSDLSQLGYHVAIFHAFLAQASAIRRAGSAALDLAYVAAGRLDGFWEFGLSPWDIAAGALLIQEAGGLICDPQGNENYFKTGDIISANPKLCKLLLRVIHKQPTKDLSC